MAGDDSEMLDAIQAGIHELDHTGMVVQYVVIAAFVGEDGEQRLYHDVMTDQRCHSTLGLLAYAHAVESAKAVRSWAEDHDA